VSEHEGLLRGGALAILPTDTVYGIGCAAGVEEACARLYAVKERPPEQPTAVVFGSVERAVEGLGDAVRSDLLPGPVTLIVPNPGRRLADAVGGLALTSANRRGEPAPGRLSDVPSELLAVAAVVVDGGTLPGVASTVIDLTGAEPVVLRQGPEIV
jgi:L-threonylcarbamoyladenylate synthase